MNKYYFRIAQLTSFLKICGMRYLAQTCEEIIAKNRNMYFFIFGPLLDFDPPGRVVMIVKSHKNKSTRVSWVWRTRI